MLKLSLHIKVYLPCQYYHQLWAQLKTIDIEEENIIIHFL